MHSFPHRILIVEAADLKLSLGSFYCVCLTNLLLAHLLQATNQEVKNKRKYSTNI